MTTNYTKFALEAVNNLFLLIYSHKISRMTEYWRLRKNFVSIAGCGLRELLEHYALFLDNIHNYCLMVQQSRKTLGERNPEKEQRNFSRNGSLSEKLRLLKERFGISIETEDSVIQLYSARNCLTHNLGIVTPERCGDNNVFVVSWIAFDTLVVGHESA